MLTTNTQRPIASYARLLVVLAFFSVASCAALSVRQYPPTPADLYGELYRNVQMQRVFADSKTFADAIPKRDPQLIVAAYAREHGRPAFDLAAFVEREFTIPRPIATEYHTPADEDVREHIDRLWSVLEREPDRGNDGSSRLPLPHPYIVPGGRFTEIYYWDSYFTMLGLEASARHELARDMCDNFAFLIARYGHIPNGSRSYYLSRSQPPFFAAMVELLAAHEGPTVYERYRVALRTEYDFWMEGGARLGPGEAHRHVVRVHDALLNRYWDDRATPRDESYREDVMTADVAGRSRADMYRNLRAAAESGWDFSSRWFSGDTRTSIRTVELIPVDLNSLMYQLELTLARAYEPVSPQESQSFRQLAAKRRDAMQRYLWNERLQAFSDYDWKNNHTVDRLTAATVVPLFCRIASADQARNVARTLSAHLLKAHGLVTTPQKTGEQWDAPNGWAPLQWMAIQGLKNYGESALAETIAARWVKQNLVVFRATGKLVEKYDVTATDAAAGGGEYPLQDGFGWTNGVLRALLQQREMASH